MTAGDRWQSVYEIERGQIAIFLDKMILDEMTSYESICIKKYLFSI